MISGRRAKEMFVPQLETNQERCVPQAQSSFCSWAVQSTKPFLSQVLSKSLSIDFSWVSVSPRETSFFPWEQLRVCLTYHLQNTKHRYISLSQVCSCLQLAKQYNCRCGWGVCVHACVYASVHVGRRKDTRKPGSLGLAYAVVLEHVLLHFAKLQLSSLLLRWFGLSGLVY